MSRFRLAVWGWHHDSNKGDAAILRGIVHHIGAEAEITELDVFVGIRRSNPSFDSALRFPLPGAALPTLYPSLLCVDPDDRGLLRALRGFFALWQLALILVLAPFGAWILPSASARALVKARVLVGKGGHYIYARPGFVGSLGLLVSMAPLLLAQRVGIPCFLLGVSVGPFPSRISAELARHVFARCSAVSVRDQESLECLLRLGVDRTRVHMATDYAFALPTSDPRASQSPSLFVNVRGTDAARAGGEQRWAAAACALLRDLKQASPQTILLPLITAAGTEHSWVAGGSSEDDRRATLNLFEAAGLAAPDLDGWESIDPQTLLGLMQDADGGFAVRLHAGLLSLAAGRPCILVDYFGTKAQVFRDLELDDWLTSFEKLDTSSERRRVVELLVSFSVDSSAARGRVQNALRIARRRLAEDVAFQRLMRVVRGEDGAQ